MIDNSSGGTLEVRGVRPANTTITLTAGDVSKTFSGTVTDPTSATLGEGRLGQLILGKKD